MNKGDKVDFPSDVLSIPVRQLETVNDSLERGL